MGSNPEQARSGAPAQHRQQAPGSPPSVTWQTPAHPASHTQAHFPTPQTPSSSPGVETQRGKWEPSLPYAGGPRPPQVGTKAGDLQEGMGEPQAVWDTCHLPTWVLPAQVLRNRWMPQRRGTVKDQSTLEQDLSHPLGSSCHREGSAGPRLDMPWPLACPCSPAWGLFLLPHPGMPLGHHQPKPAKHPVTT